MTFPDLAWLALPVGGVAVLAVVVACRLRRRRGAEIEQEWRGIREMPRRHPESLTRPLRRRDERAFTALRQRLADIDHGAEL